MAAGRHPPTLNAEPHNPITFSRDSCKQKTHTLVNNPVGNAWETGQFNLSINVTRSPPPSEQRFLAPNGMRREQVNKVPEQVNHSVILL